MEDKKQETFTVIAYPATLVDDGFIKWEHTRGFYDEGLSYFNGSNVAKFFDRKGALSELTFQ